MPVYCATHDLPLVREVAPPAARCTYQRGLPAEDIDASLRRAVRDPDQAEGNVLLWFYEMSRRRLYADLGYATMQHYATERLAFSVNKTYRFEGLVRDLHELPVLRAALAENQIGWTKVRVLVEVASPENEGLWVEKARALSRRELEREVARAKRLALSSCGATARQAELGAIPPAEPAPRSEVATGNAPAAPIDGLVDGPVDGPDPLAALAAGSEATRSAGSTGAEAMIAPSSRPVSSSPVRPGSSPVAPESSRAAPESMPAAPATIRLRLSPLQVARYEAIRERLHRSRAPNRRRP